MPSLRSGITSGLGLCIRPYRYASQLVRRYDNGIETQATEHIPTATNQRFLTDISSVNEFYSLPKKQNRPASYQVHLSKPLICLYTKKRRISMLSDLRQIDYLIGYWLHIRLHISIWERMIIFYWLE